MSSLTGKRFGFLAVALLGSLLVFASAQEPKQANQGSNAAASSKQQDANSQPQKKSAGKQNESFGQTLVKESEEAEGDDTAEFKGAPAVRFLARITGMSLHSAWWVALLSNFAVIAIVIIWASRKFLPGFFRQRTADIQKAMEEARKASADANRRLSDIEARLSRIDSEIGTMRAAAEKEAAAEEARIQAAAQEDSRKIVESAEQEILAAAKQVRRELTAYAADLAVTLAKKQIHVDASTDQRLVHDFAEQLSNGGKGGR